MSSTIQLSKRANWAGYEIANSPRDGRELRSGKEKHEAEAVGLPDTETCNQCGTLVGELYPRHEEQTKEIDRNDRKQI